ncbi:DUF4190 domain-containing protein [Pistricoccus aurantiacus]|uniref:DUF4190 domain-containing protein n=1 Tax=Pistricoccus aurantiacus TaxID=1883414 RepID=UPI00363EE753
MEERTTGSTNPSNESRPRYSGWALAALATAFLALFFDAMAAFVSIIAAVFALLGLRQIRRSPTLYKGRALCWIAIGLGLVMAVLVALVEPGAGS